MKTENKFAYFNILRFIGAIVIAILLHWNDHLLTNLNVSNTLFSSNSLLGYLSKNGYVFTEMFYIISGFLFARVYMKRILSKKGMSFKSFMCSRYIRIFPLVIISTIVMYGLNLIYYNQLHSFFSCGNLKFIDLFFDILFAGTATLGMGANPLNGPLWYIGPLMLCYMLAYILTNHYRKHKSYWIFVIPIIVSIFVLKKNFIFFIINLNVARAMVSFFAGILLGNEKVFEYLDNLSIKKNIIMKLAILVFLILYMHCAFLPNSSEYFGGYFDVILTYSLIFFPLLIVLLYNVKFVNDLGNTKLFKFLGNISFSIYVWNFPIMIIWTYLINSRILNINISSYKFMIANTFIHIIIAALSYIFIENKLVDRIKTKVK